MVVHVIERLLVTPDAGPGLGGPGKVFIVAMACGQTRVADRLRRASSGTVCRRCETATKHRNETPWERSERKHSETVARDFGTPEELDEAVRALLALQGEDYEAEVDARKDAIVYAARVERAEVKGVFVRRGEAGIRKRKRRKKAQTRAARLAGARIESAKAKIHERRLARVCVKCGLVPWEGPGETCAGCVDREHLHARDKAARVVRLLRYGRMIRRFNDAKAGRYNPTLQEYTAALARKKKLPTGSEKVSL